MYTFTIFQFIRVRCFRFGGSLVGSVPLGANSTQYTHYLHLYTVIYIDIGWHTYTFMYIHTYIEYSHTYIQMYMYVCLYLYVCICMHVYVCVYIYVCVCMYVCISVCMCVYVCVYVCMCMCVCIIYWGELFGGNVLPKTGGGLVRGNCAEGIVL